MRNLNEQVDRLENAVATEASELNTLQTSVHHNAKVLKSLSIACLLVVVGAAATISAVVLTRDANAPSTNASDQLVNSKGELIKSGSASYELSLLDLSGVSLNELASVNTLEFMFWPASSAETPTATILKVDQVLRGNDSVTSFLGAAGNALHLTDAGANFTSTHGYGGCAAGTTGCTVLLAPVAAGGEDDQDERRLWAFGTWARSLSSDKPNPYSAGDEHCCCKAGCPPWDGFCQFMCKSLGGTCQGTITNGGSSKLRDKCRNTGGNWFTGYDCASTCPSNSQEGH